MAPNEHSPGKRSTDDGAAALPGLQLFLEQLFELSGVDLSGYGKRALQRRLRSVMSGAGVSSVADLGDRMRSDPRLLGQVLDKLMLRVTTMFRNPSFFRCFRELVAPLLHTYAHPRLWVAGCSTGQEAFSLAILLREEGLYDRCRIYATDINETVLEQARSGLLPLSSLDEFEQNYRASGGVRQLADYYTRGKSWAVMDPAVMDRIAVFRHDLARDASFNEFHVIFCRNVLMYFDAGLRCRAHRLFCDSLVRLGFLGLGQSESLLQSQYESRYEPLSSRQRIYRRVR